MSAPTPVFSQIASLSSIEKSSSDVFVAKFSTPDVVFPLVLTEVEVQKLDFSKNYAVLLVEVVQETSEDVSS